MPLSLMLLLAVVTQGPPLAEHARVPATTDSGLSLRINLPSFELEVYDGDSLIRRYRVAIGDTAYPTPVGEYAITRVDWDPWWIPPASEWLAREKVTPPGPQNPMGRVRLLFKDLYFIHGSPLSATIGSAASHGCIRLANSDAVDLARLVTARAAPGFPPAELDRLASERDTASHTIRLDSPVPVTIRYETSVVAGGRLTVYPDVYRKAPEDRLAGVLALLQETFGSAETIDTARVRAVVDRAGSGSVSVPLSDLPERLPDPR